MLKKDKVLVTGGAGYIGSVLTRRLLANDYHVCVLDNLMYGGGGLLGVWSHPEFEFIRGDIQDAECVGKLLEDVDAVVHLAAIVGDPACSRNPDLAVGVNLDASLSLLSKCADSGVFRFIFASTCSNYGRMKDVNRFVDETSELKPVSLYARTKVAVEEAVLNAATTKDMCATCLRFATVYGTSPRMRFDLTVNQFTMEMLTRKRLVVYGGRFWRPYVHVTDIAEAIKLVLEAPAEKVDNEVFNVGSTDQNFRKEQIVHKDEDPRDYRVDFSKIQNRLGFEAGRTVEDGIAEVAMIVRKKIIEDYDSPRYRNTPDETAPAKAVQEPAVV